METTEANKETNTMNSTTTPQRRPVKNWRWFHGVMTPEPFKGKWEYEPGCECAKCENHWNMLASCVGDEETV